MVRPPVFLFFFFNDTATTEIYTLSLHDALPIYLPRRQTWTERSTRPVPAPCRPRWPPPFPPCCCRPAAARATASRSWPKPAPPRCCRARRSEEHTSELQSPCNLVCRLLLETKKTK